MIRFRENNFDANLFLQLQDLASVLSGIPDLKFQYAYGSAIDINAFKVTASSNWGIGNQSAQEAGMKTDIFLRTIGTLHHSDIFAMKNFMAEINESSLEKFAIQLFTLFEDIRLEEIVKSKRPGTKNLFSIRQAYLKQYFTQQLKTNVTRSFALDELFCLIYLVIQADTPDPSFPGANKQQIERLMQLKNTLFEVFEAKSTKQTTAIAEKIVFMLDDDYVDMVHTYFVSSIASLSSYTEQNAFDELTRTDPLKYDEQEDVDEEKNDVFEENLSTWHAQNENTDRKQNFLQFELDEGTKTNLAGSGARETEEGDQAMASIQGSSGKSEKNDYSNLEAMPEKEGGQGEESAGTAYGAANKHAVKVIKKADSPTVEDVSQYQDYTAEIAPFQRKLSNTIEKMLEHKQNAPRSNLLTGRLSKKLVNVAIQEYPRLFYKKNQESKEMDAAFTLLVDCSASMLNKMEETKKGIVLFHEVLKRLKIPHSIIGFWEEATEVKETYQPNYFHVVHDFADSFYGSQGAAIMQLEAQEDNRDGYSIRIAAEELLNRNEKNKFLLVFSDGEPAASDYTENGIIDTNLAVSETRKKGIDVVGMFLAEGEVTEEADNLMQNIYGRERVMVPTVDELPDHFSPLLKKLLLKVV